jgi:hypothetical protein
VPDNEFKQDNRVYGPLTFTSYVKFLCNNTSAPTVQLSRGVVSVTRTGVGVYDVVLAHKWKNLKCYFSQGGAVAALTARPTKTSEAVATRTVTITLITTVASPAAGDMTAVTIEAYFGEEQG